MSDFNVLLLHLCTHFVFCYNNTDLSATFEESTASVVESELSVEACIILSNSALERDIVITVTSEQDTATGTLYVRVIHNYYG